MRRCSQVNELLLQVKNCSVEFLKFEAQKLDCCKLFLASEGKITQVSNSAWLTSDYYIEKIFVGA